jgi:hypothetical protein
MAAEIKAQLAPPSVLRVGLPRAGVPRGGVPRAGVLRAALLRGGLPRACVPRGGVLRAGLLLRAGADGPGVLRVAGRGADGDPNHGTAWAATPRNALCRGASSKKYNHRHGGFA